jgi:protein-tyrosine-phosphatase
MAIKKEKNRKTNNKNVLYISFICTGNTCRSYIAEAVAAHLLKTIYFKKKPKIKDKVIIGSAGTDVLLNKVPVNTFKVLEKMEIPNFKFRPRQVDLSIINNSDLLIAMATSHKKNIISQFEEVDKKKVFTLIELANIILYLESEDIFKGNNNDKNKKSTIKLAHQKIDLIKEMKTDSLIKPYSIDIEDPFGRSINIYMKVAKLIKENIITIFNYLFK